MPTVQRRVSPNGKISYRALVRLKGHKSKTATFLKRADAVAWGQEMETRIRQSKYFPFVCIYTILVIITKHDRRKQKQKGE